MADISAEIADFRDAAYGEDVRSAMISLANKLNGNVETVTTKSDSALSTANSAKSVANETKTVVDNINDFVSSRYGNITQDHITVTNDALLYDISHTITDSPDVVIENNIITMNYPSSGNTWPRYKFYISDGIVLKIVVNITSISGPCKAYVLYTNLNNQLVFDDPSNFIWSAEYSNFRHITEAKEYVWILDLSRVTNIDRKKPIEFAIANNANSGQCVINRFDTYLLGSNFNSLPKSLNSILNELANMTSDKIIVQNTLVKDFLALYNVTYKDRSDYSTYVLDHKLYTYRNTSTSGNDWQTFNLNVSDYEAGSVLTWHFRVNFDTNISPNSLRPYLIYKNTSGGTVYNALDPIENDGEYYITIDPNYLAVYGNWDGTSPIQPVLATRTSPCGFIVDIDQIELSDSGWDNTPRSLNGVLNDIRYELDSGGSGGSTDNIEIAGSDGRKYLVQAGNNGSIVLVPKIPNNILYMGNSLLVGFGNHGMASTTVNDDYVYKINNYLANLGVTPTYERLASYGFEACTNNSEVESWISNTLASHLNNDIELIIVQLSDNVNTDAKNECFRNSCGRLISYLRTTCPNARIAWVAAWYWAADKQALIKNMCDKYGAVFIDIHDCYTHDNQSYIGAEYIDANGNTQTITSSGVASHPSNTGFTAIANRIIETLFE